MDLGELTAQAMLCDFAEVSGNKLFISGAGINLIGTDRTQAPLPVNFALALLIRIPWTATNQQHTLKVELFSDTSDKGPQLVVLNEGEPPTGKDEDRGSIVGYFNMGRSPAMQVGEESLLPVAFPLQGLPLPDMGSYYFLISIDGTEVQRISFRITSISNLSGFPVTGVS